MWPPPPTLGALSVMYRKWYHKTWYFTYHFPSKQNNLSCNPNQLLRYSFRANANAPLMFRVKEEKRSNVCLN